MIHFQSLKSQLRVQLAPSIEHQVSAMVAIMDIAVAMMAVIVAVIYHHQ